ncbi:9200_t:CDS:2 [Gigaspora margarita]|uniref:9200_t:CDS:1 n=1 Tax=Gigaspora margarita TaxID=4874 RepID=A0ABN7UUL9_GIGMA|nr:9200_t:CDS:2 [Gigaspora margarita]
MSQNKVKLVTIEDESLSSSNSDAEAVSKSNQSNFDANFGEAKRRNGLVGSESLGKDKVVELDSNPKPSFADGSRVNIEAGQAFANVFGNPLSHSGSSSSKMGYDLPPRMPPTEEEPYN